MDTYRSGAVVELQAQGTQHKNMVVSRPGMPTRESLLSSRSTAFATAVVVCKLAESLRSTLLLQIAIVFTWIDMVAALALAGWARAGATQSATTENSRETATAFMLRDGSEKLWLDVDSVCVL
jgi:hypothetical protein